MVMMSCLTGRPAAVRRAIPLFRGFLSTRATLGAASPAPASSARSSASPDTSGNAAAATPTPTPTTLFDTNAKALQKARAALRPDAARYEYLRDHMASLLVDRMEDVARQFPNVLDLFCGSGHILRALRDTGNRPGVRRLYHADVHEAVISRAARHYSPYDVAAVEDAFVFDERQRLPIAPAHLDAVMSGGALHWVSDLPSVLGQLRRSLRPDGMLLCAMLGGDTLHELRVSLQLAEDEVHSRVSARVSPMVRVADAARLLSDTGFALPTADTEKVVVSYADMHALLHHLRGMGDTNALSRRQAHYGRDTFRRAAEIYDERFGFAAEGEGPGAPGRRVKATFEMVFMIGWAPSDAQRKPLARGSAPVSLAKLADDEKNEAR